MRDKRKLVDPVFGILCVRLSLHSKQPCTHDRGPIPSTSRGGLQIILARNLCSRTSLRLDAEMAGNILPLSAQVHPSIGEAAAAFPRLAFVDSLFVVSSGYNCGVPVGMDYHLARLQYLGVVGLIRYRGDNLRFVVKRAFGHGHDEIVRQ